MADVADGTARLRAEITRVQVASREVAAALEALQASCATADELLVAGSTPIEAYRACRFAAVRDEFFAAFDRFNQQLTVMRAEGVRLLVDAEGRTLTEVATIIGRSRQFASRLYHQAKSRP
jgi:fructose-1-phosphate kinase PfkB-like protein